MNEEIQSAIADAFPISKVSVCPDCYEDVIVEQVYPVGGENLWVCFCPCCKRQVEPKQMKIKERQFLNARAMRKAKEAKP